MSFRDRMMARAPSPLSGMRIAVCLADEDTSIDWIPRHLSYDLFYHTWDYCTKPPGPKGAIVETWFDAAERLPEGSAGLEEAQRLYSIMLASHVRRRSDEVYDVVVMGSTTADMTKVIRPKPNTVYGRVSHDEEKMAFGLSSDFFFADHSTFTKVADAFRYLSAIRPDALRVEHPNTDHAFYYHCCQLGIEVEPL